MKIMRFDQARAPKAKNNFKQSYIENITDEWSRVASNKRNLSSTICKKYDLKQSNTLWF